jgi:hypothetical protein
MANQLPQEIDICRVRGDTFPFTVQIRQNGTAVDITGYTVVMTVNRQSTPSNTDRQLFQSTGVINDGPSGQVVFTLTPTQANQTPGDYFYDMQYTDGGGFVRTFVKGAYQVVQDITK